MSLSHCLFSFALLFCLLFSYILEFKLLFIIVLMPMNPEAFLTTKLGTLSMCWWNISLMKFSLTEMVDFYLATCKLACSYWFGHQLVLIYWEKPRNRSELSFSSLNIPKFSPSKEKKGLSQPCTCSSITYTCSNCR